MHTPASCLEYSFIHPAGTHDMRHTAQHYTTRAHIHVVSSVHAADLFLLLRYLFIPLYERDGARVLSSCSQSMEQEYLDE